MSLNAKQNKSAKQRPVAARPSVVFSPDLLDGINVITNMVRPTLGPLPRHVAMERMNRDKAPELLDDAATLARRVVQLPEPTTDVGAMMLRHALWRMNETTGDGGAITAVLVQAMVQQGMKALAAGANAALLRNGIEKGIERACEALRAQAMPVPGGKRGSAMLKGMAYALCSDDELAERLAETVHFVGPEGVVQVINHEPRRIDREYVEGSMWESPWHSAAFATDKGRTITQLNDVALVLVDSQIETGEQAFEGLKRLNAMGHQRIAIITETISEEAMQIFNMAQHRAGLQLALIKTPYMDGDRTIILEDICALTGARIIVGSGAGFAAIEAEDVGEVRRLWCNSSKFGLIGGRRDGVELRERIRMARNEIANLRDLDRLSKLQQRLGRLLASWALLRVGGTTSGHAEARQDQARRYVRTLQTALREGVVAGGGAAFVACQPALSLTGTAKKARKGDAVAALPAMVAPTSVDEQMGIGCVREALAAPFSAILQNAGFDASPWVIQVREAGAPMGVDVRKSPLDAQAINMVEAGIVDSMVVLEQALRVAGSTAAMVLTTDAVVHHKSPTTAVKP